MNLKKLRLMTMFMLMASAVAAAIPSPATASGDCITLVGPPAGCESLPVCVLGAGAEIQYGVWFFLAGGGIFPVGVAAGAGTHECHGGLLGPPSNLG